MRKSKWIPAAVSGLLLTAAFPKVGLSLLAWVALVPLLIALRDADAAQAFRVGMIAGLAHFLTLIYWVAFTMRTYGYLPWWQCFALLVLLASYLSLYPALFATGVVRCSRRPGRLIVLAPVFWVALEYLRGILLTGFPWGLIGYSQFNRLHIIQISDIFGVYGVSFMVVFVNACAFMLLLFWARKTWQRHPVGKPLVVKTSAAAIVVIVLTIAYGNQRIDAMDAVRADAPARHVAIVQGNIDQAHKWDPAFQIGTTKKYLALTAEAALLQPDLVVWPETATPFYFTASPQLTRLVTDTVVQAGVHLLVGSPRVQADAGGPAYYNSAFLVTPQGLTQEHYDKVHLVPFGEYVPLKSLLSFVGKMVAQVGDFSPGEKGRTLAWEANAPIGVQIGFEIIFPGLSRALAKNGAGMLVNLTNDAWFGRSSAAYQHFSMAVFRAVENRRSVVRCANTGISGFIDPVGRIHDRTALFEDAVIDRRVAEITRVSAYTQLGDVLPIVCLALSGLLVGARLSKGGPRLPGGRTMEWIQRMYAWASRKGGRRR